MATVKTSKGEIDAPRKLVVRFADRFHPFGRSRREHALAKAKRRMAGKYPRASDAAMVVALG